jgi:hypothetical protein
LKKKINEIKNDENEKINFGKENKENEIKNDIQKMMKMKNCVKI